MMSNHVRAGLTILLVSALFLFTPAAGRAEKPIFVETYDGLSEVMVDGLVLHGVSYSCTVDGAPQGNLNDCVVRLPNWWSGENTIIAGDPKVLLHLTFDVPTTVFGFDVGFNTGDTKSDSVIVNLYRPGIGLLREEVFLDAITTNGWAVARYDYDGPAVKTVTIQFNPASGLGGLRFGLDNLTYFRPKGQSKP